MCIRDRIMTAMIDAVRRKEASGMVERFSHHSFLTLRPVSYTHLGGGGIDAANTAEDHVDIMKKAYELGKNL